MVGAFPLALPTNRGGQGITYMEATPAELGGPGMDCRTPLHEEFLQHYEHKEDPGVTPRTSGAIGESAQSDTSVGEGPGH